MVNKIPFCLLKRGGFVHIKRFASYCDECIALRNARWADGGDGFLCWMLLEGGVTKGVARMGENRKIRLPSPNLPGNVAAGFSGCWLRSRGLSGEIPARWPPVDCQSGLPGY